MARWGFYGRGDELRQLATIFAQRRWFFLKVMGRRRIGKTALIREALKQAGGRTALYVQIPDSAAPGVLSAVHDANGYFSCRSGALPPAAIAAGAGPDHRPDGAHIERFLAVKRDYESWQIEKVCIAPHVSQKHRARLKGQSIVEDLNDLTRGM